MILIDGHPRHDWLLKAVNQRLREELAKLQVELNEEKSRSVDLAKGESFGFLGFDVPACPQPAGRVAMPTRPRSSRSGRRCCGSSRRSSGAIAPSRSGGWSSRSTRSFGAGCATSRIGNSSRCFAFVRRLGGEEVRRHLMRARKRRASAGGSGVCAWLYRRPGPLRRLPGPLLPAAQKASQHDRAHNPWREADRRAQCGKSARCVRGGGGWRRESWEPD